MAATISTPIIESMPRSLKDAPSGISSFSAISCTSARSCSLRPSLVAMLISPERSGEPSLDFVEEVAHRLDARQTLVGNLDLKPPLERPDDLEDAERIDRELTDVHRLQGVVEVLLHHF